MRKEVQSEIWRGRTGGKKCNQRSGEERQEDEGERDGPRDDPKISHWNHLMIEITVTSRFCFNGC